MRSNTAQRSHTRINTSPTTTTSISTHEQQAPEVTQPAAENRNHTRRNVVPATEEIKNFQLTRDRERRQPKPTNMYGFSNMVTYSLSTCHDIEYQEPQNFTEAST